ncbi:ferredoxin [Rhodococcus koreensis]
MKFEVDLNRCMNHGQCTYSAPETFSMDDRGQLSFRRQTQDVYVSPDIDPGQVDAVEESADMCPSQAIRLLQSNSTS